MFVIVLFTLSIMYTILRRLSYFEEDLDFIMLILRCALVIIRFLYVANSARTNVRNMKELGPVKLDEYQNPSDLNVEKKSSRIAEYENRG